MTRFRGVELPGPRDQTNPGQQEQGGVGASAQREAASGGGPRGIVFRGGRGSGQPLRKTSGAPRNRIPWGEGLHQTLQTIQSGGVPTRVYPRGGGFASNPPKTEA